MNNDLISRSALLDELIYHKEELIMVFDSLENGIEKRLCNSEICGILSVILQVYATPAVDAVEVVRCKDCKHKEYLQGAKDEAYVCSLGWGLKGIVAEEDFCSYGKREG